MRMIGVLSLVVSVWMAVCVASVAQEKPANLRMKELREELKPLSKDLNAARMKLALNKDAEIIALKKAIQTAQETYRAAVDAKLDADPEASRIKIRIGQINAEIKELAEKAKPVKKEKPRKKEKEAPAVQ